MPKFNHAYDFAFEVISENEEADDVTPAQIRTALIARATSLSDKEILQACGRYDVFQMEGDQDPTA
jgi:hypothetical protein